MNEFQGGYGAGVGMGGQLAPQGFLGGLIGAPLGGLIGKGVGGLFGRPDLGSQIGNIAGGIGGSLLPFGTDPISAAYQQQAIQQQLQQQQLQQLQQAQQGGQFGPQGWVGNLIGAVGKPLGGIIGGAFGNQQLGSTIGGVAGQLGRMLPFGADPVSAAYQDAALQQMQQQQAGQFAPQGWFGNLIGAVGQPLGGAIGGALGNAQLGSTIGGMAGQLGRMLPFGADPSMMQAQQVPQHVLLQQIQQLQQQLQQYQQQYAQLLQQVQQQQQQAQGAQQGQIAPQGWFGNLISAVGQPLGGAIGGALGNSQLGSTIGGVAGQLGRMLPFGADPLTQAYMQQAQLAQQQAQLAQQQGQMGQGNSYFPTQGQQYIQQPTLH